MLFPSLKGWNWVRIRWMLDMEGSKKNDNEFLVIVDSFRTLWNGPKPEWELNTSYSILFINCVPLGTFLVLSDRCSDFSMSLFFKPFPMHSFKLNYKHANTHSCAKSASLFDASNVVKCQLKMIICRFFPETNSDKLLRSINFPHVMWLIVRKWMLPLLSNTYEKPTVY